MTDRLFPDPPARLHFIGLKGVAMTAFAEVLRGHGYDVSGSDTAELFFTDAVLKKLNIHCAEGFAEENITSSLDAVIYSTAYEEDHIERQAARRLGIPEWSYPEAVAFLFTAYTNSISVAGSHGKTTTTALLGNILTKGNFDPTAIVGSIVTEWGTNARVGKSEWFVFETDEYQNKLKYYTPRYVLLTNVDYDHPDFFHDAATYERAFLDFVERIPAHGALVLWGDDPLRLSLLSATHAPVVTYGVGEENDWQLTDVTIDERGTTFTAVYHADAWGTFTVPFPGEHYALNALGAIALSHYIGVDPEGIRRGVEYFRGTARRFEVRGVVNGATVIDDYAHHPSEILATLTGLRLRYPEKRLRVIFHPHTFTRTAAFQQQFVTALGHADDVAVLPIYGSAREGKGSVASDDIVRQINHVSPGKARVISDIAAAIHEYASSATDQDVIVTMGAGDVWRVAEGLVQ